MPHQPHGCHLIAGERVATAQTFLSEPASGPAHAFSSGSAALIDRACKAAESAFGPYSATSRADRARFLDTIAECLDARAEAITEIGCQETGLPAARLQGERGRTTGQLRLFAAHIRAGTYLDLRHDTALPERQPLPRPDIRMMQQPIGPVAVFGASNFPLAFSVAGGDTASALAAGCPVVVKGHSAHPGTGELAADAVAEAAARCGLPAGVFSLVQGGQREVGAALVTHPLIKAVGFTGSLAGGRALFDLCAGRPEPIPFFGELGSVNPMFLLPHALSTRMDQIVAGWAASLTQGAGQFCTNPGIAVVPAALAEPLGAAMVAALGAIGSQTMLTEGIATAFVQGRDRMAGETGVRELLVQMCDRRQASPQLFVVQGRDWIGNHVLQHEVFGPLALIIAAQDDSEMLEIAQAFDGQLTCTLFMDDPDTDLARRLMPVLQRKAGRILANGFPTGVEVCEAMVHGGPYPASTNFGATSVGTLAIRRFLRPVSYQNLPDALLPEDLRTIA
jgi:2,5-dioxopentanoate dehydrogenase